jgi:predicted  nucleic acid-binding Zn-ribbon protein
MSSIDGPSDFTANMFDYMKGNKQRGTGKTGRPKTRIKAKTRPQLKADVSGIIIESPSEFSDDLTNPTISSKDSSSPAKSEQSDVDGPSDFTANIVEYINGTKKQSQTGTVAATKTHTLSINAAASKTPIQTTKAAASKKQSPTLNTTISKKAATTKASPEKNEHPIIEAQADFKANLAEYINGGRKQSPPPSTLAKNFIKKTPTARTSPAKREDSINSPSDGTEDMNGSKKQSLNSKTSTARPKEPTTTTASPAKSDDSIDGPSDFTANIVEYMKGTKKQSPNTNTTPKKTSSARTSPVNMKGNKYKPPSVQDESQIDGPSDFTANIVDYMKGTKPYSPPRNKTSSSATAVAHVDANMSLPKTVNNTREQELQAQIAQLQAQLLQRDTTISGLQNALTAVEEKNTALQSELEQKNTAIDTLQTTLKQSNQQCEGLELELHQMEVEVNDLQENLNVSPPIPNPSNQHQTDIPTKDVIVNTVQHKDAVINRLHNTNADLKEHIEDLRTEISEKDLLLIETVEEVRKPQSEIDCEFLKDAITQYVAELDAQYDAAERAADEKKGLEGTISALNEKQERMEQEMKQMQQKLREAAATAEEKETEWRGKVEGLAKEVKRRGDACLELWGMLEHPGERDGEGRQKYTYKYVKKGSRAIVPI